MRKIHLLETTIKFTLLLLIFASTSFREKRSADFAGLYFRDLGAKLFSWGINFRENEIKTFYFEDFVIVLHFLLLKIINS